MFNAKKLLSIILIFVFFCSLPYTADAFVENPPSMGQPTFRPGQINLDSVSEPANGVLLRFHFNTDFDPFDTVVIPEKEFTVIAYSASDRSRSICSRTYKEESDTFSGEFEVVFPKFYFLNDHEYIFRVYGTVSSSDIPIVLNACNEPKDLFRSNGISYNLHYNNRIFYSTIIKESGYYEFIPSGLNNYTSADGQQIGFHSYPSGESVGEHIKYYEKGTEVIYTATSENPAKVSAVFRKVEYSDEECLNDNPSANGDLVYSIKKNSGFRRIKIVTYGTYSAHIKNDNGSYCPFYLYDENGNLISDIGHSFGIVHDSFILNPGYYYVDTNRGNEYAEPAPDEATLDLTYTLPDTIEPNTLYKLSPEESGFYNLNITQPGYIKLNTVSGYPYVTFNDGGPLYEYPVYMQTGRYMLNIDIQYESEFRIEYESINSVALNEEAVPVHNDGNSSFLAFCAPESGEYEFDFSKSENPYSYKTFDSENSTDLGIVYRTMNKDQWVLITCEQNTRLTVRKYDPTPVSLQTDTTITTPLVRGEKLLYTYTPTDSAQHLLELDNVCDVSIYTDNATIFSGSSEYMKPFYLQGGEKVYIKIQSTVYSQWSDTLSVTLSTNDTISVESNVSFDLNDDMQTFCSLAADETGYYNLEISKEGYSHYSFCTYVCDNEYYIGEYSNTINALAYIEKGTPLIIRFDACGDGNYCTAKVTAEAIETTPIMCDTEIMVNDNNTYLFTPDSEGVYAIDTGSEAGSTVSYGTITVVSDKGGAPLINTFNMSIMACGSEAGYAIRFAKCDKATISKIPTESITTNHEYKASNQDSAFVFTPEAGVKYRIENTEVNTELYVYANNEWNKMAREFGNVIESNSNSNIFIAALAQNCSDGMSSPQAKLKIIPDFNPSEQALSVCAEDFYKVPEGRPPMADLKFTAPLGSTVNVGAEIVHGSNRTLPEPHLEKMVNTETGYITQYMFGCNFEIGETYTVRPYIYTENDPQNWIYGEEKTFVYDITKKTIVLKHSATPVTISMQDNYSTYGKMVYMEFTCPQDASKTYFTLPSFTDNFYLYNQNDAFIEILQDSEGSYAYLTPGEKYYISAFFRKEGVGTVSVSCLPDRPEYIKNITVDKTLQTITYTHELKEENAQIMIAALNSYNDPLSICTAPSAPGENTANVKNLNEAKKVKIIYINKTNLQPLSHATVIELE